MFICRRQQQFPACRNEKISRQQPKHGLGVSQETVVDAYRVGTLMSDNKPENRTADSVGSEPFCDAQWRERLVQELRTRAERFCEQASWNKSSELR
jgi:hypothetical protein